MFSACRVSNFHIALEAAGDVRGTGLLPFFPKGFCIMSDILKTIDDEIKSNDVILFMKGTPEFPM